MFGLGKDKTIQEGLYALSTAIVIASVILSFSLIYTGSLLTGRFAGVQTGNEQQPQQPSQAQPQQQGQQAWVSVDDDPVMKTNANAPVTIIEFAEFQCPFCGRFARDTFPKIKTNYIDTGKVKFVFRDFVVHSTAHLAAEASECAHEQGKFWEYHDVLFNNQGSLDSDSLKKYASDIGLDTAKFNSCLDSGKYKSEVDKDISDGRSYGVRGTPTFFINGEKLVGAQPYETFRQAIEKALAG